MGILQSSAGEAAGMPAACFAGERMGMTKKSIKELRENIKTSGRVYYDEPSETLYLNWSACEVEFLFEGSILAAEFTAMAGIEYEGIPGDTSAPTHENWPQIAVYVDGELKRRQEICAEPEAGTEAGTPGHSGETFQRVLLFFADAPERHRIKIVKLTENLKTELGIRSLSSDGTITKPCEEAKKKRIEFIGDSITCGFGNRTKERDRLFFTSDEDATRSHGYLAAKLLGMEHSLVCVSGICAVVNSGLPMEYAMEELYAYTDRIICDKLAGGVKKGACAPYEFKENPNDYVVLNLGTNDATGIVFSRDAAAETEHFRAGYRKLIELIRRCNGSDTYIVCALGSLNYYLYSDIETIVDAYQKETGDKNISCFRYLGMSPMDGFGACGHPSGVTQEKMAGEIAEEIRRIEEIQRIEGEKG